MDVGVLREKALANFDVLLNYWGLTYKKITPYEYDIIASWRKDDNFGGCRFNVEKARGADFAGGSFDEQAINSLGSGFTRDDYLGYVDSVQTKIGFDIIGLVQRVHGASSNKDAIQHLNNDLEEISKTGTLISPAFDAAIRRERENKEKEDKARKYANDLWEACKYHKLENSVGEKYLISRNINIRDKNIRVHPSIIYTPTKTKYSALIFRVQKTPVSPLCAVHRIFLGEDGKKAKIPNPKMALAPIKGAGIWFGEPSRTLAITEGPENALSVMKLGYTFVVSSIFGPNLHNLSIPPDVKDIIIFPDIDEPGLAALERAKLAYGRLNLRSFEIYLPPDVVLPTGKKMDINDLIIGETNAG